MRKTFDAELQELNAEMIDMAAAAEDVIDVVTASLSASDRDAAKAAIDMTRSMDQMERDIENRCLRLLLQQQPQTAVFNVTLHLVHAAGHIDGRLGRVPVRGREGRRDHVDHVLRSGGHVYHLRVELLELSIKSLAHIFASFCQVRAAGRAPLRWVMQG